MSDIRQRFAWAQASFGELVHQVKDDQWGDPTPCSEWNVRTLVNHLVYEARWAVPLLAGQTIEQVGDKFDGDLLGDDPRTSYDAALRDASGAVRAVDLDRIVHLSFGDLPASEYLTQITTDFIVHRWDLARGIGADDRIDPDMATFAYNAAEPMAEMIAASGMFGQRLPVEDEAGTQTKLLALMGRRA